MAGHLQNLAVRERTLWTFIYPSNRSLRVFKRHSCGLIHSENALLRCWKPSADYWPKLRQKYHTSSVTMSCRTLPNTGCRDGSTRQIVMNEIAQHVVVRRYFFE